MPLAVIFFIQKSSITDVWLGSKCASDSIHPSFFFLRENNKHLPISIFCHCIPCIVITSFSLYPLSCLLNSNGYCFTFSHNIPSYFKVSVDSCQYLFLYFIFTCKNVAAKAHVWSHLQFSFKFSSYFMK